MKCPNCGTMNPDDNLFCEECGEKLEMPKLLCPECGKEQKKDDPKFCPFCGYRFQSQPLIGDKNVISGDVTSDSHNTFTNTTIYNGIMPGQSSADTVECHVCGRLLKKDSGDVFRCRSCKHFICSDCYDRETRMCLECSSKAKAKETPKKATRPELAAFDYEELGNGKVSLISLKNKKVMSATIPSCVESIGESCFEGSNLVMVDIVPGVLSIGRRAFANCKKLTEVKLHDGLKFIEEEAFAGCTDLDTTVPSSCKLGKNAFVQTAYQTKTEKEFKDSMQAIRNFGLEDFFGLGKKKSASSSADFAATGLDESVRKEWEQACAGDAGKQFLIAYYYDAGNHAAKDIKKAATWYHKAAENGNALAQYNYGVYLYNGKGVAKSYEEAAKWWGKAAEQGHANAQLWYGICFADGKGVAKSYEEAVKWYRKAAEQGVADAQYRVAYAYDSGQGVSKSYEEAARWYGKAAENGNAHAQYNYGVYLYLGKGVAKSYEEAAKWWGKAAEQGHDFAQLWYGICLKNGQGVTKSLTEAKKWIEKAAAKGNADAKKELAKL